MAGLAGYSFYKDITLGTSALISADVVDCTFAVTFTSAETGFWTHQDGAGEYVRWTLPDNTLLAFDVERYDTVNQVAVWHVKVPVAYAAADTVIQCQYSTTNPTDGSNRAGSFDASTALAMHLSVNQAGGAMVDATGNYTPVDAFNNIFDAAGVIDQGQRAVVYHQRIDCGDIAELNGVSHFTLECSIKREPGTAYAYITKHLPSDWGHRVALLLWYDGSAYFVVANSTSYAWGFLPGPIGSNWRHYVMVFDGTGATNADRLKVYIDGVLQTLTFTGTIPSITASPAANLSINYAPGASSEYASATYDELTVSSVSRSADWVTLRNANAHGTIVTSIGPEKGAGIALSANLAGVSTLDATLSGGTMPASGTVTAQSSLTGGLIGGTNVSDKTKWNPNDKDPGVSLSADQLTAASTVLGWRSVRAVDGKSANKWYWEVTSTVHAAGTNNVVGIGTASANLASYPGGDAYSWGYSSSPGIYHGGAAIGSAPVFSQGDVIGVALDMDSGNVWFSLNGVWLNGGDPATGYAPSASGITGTIYPMVSGYPNGNELRANFGQNAFVYTPPAGYIAGPDVWLQRAVCIGDSIAYGQGSTSVTLESRIEALQSLNAGDVLNKGWQGEKTDALVNRFQTDALNIKAGQVFIVSGTNNNFIAPTRTIAQTISDYTSMLNMALAMSPVPDVILAEVTPSTKSGGGASMTKEQIQEWTKLLNAEIRKLCIEKSMKMAPSYQEMCDTSTLAEDDLRPAYAFDTVHPNDTGYTRMGELLNIGALPSRMYKWGQAVVTVDEEGWSWWVLNGTASVTGDANTGTLTLPQAQNADSTVKCLEAGQKSISITPTVTGGTVTIKYRTSTGNFDRVNATIPWQTYTGAFSTTDQFIQIRLQGASPADATVTDVSLTWGVGGQNVTLSGSASGVSSLSATIGLGLGAGGSLSGASTLSGTVNLGSTVSLAGTLASASVTTATPMVLRDVAGTIPGVSTLGAGLAAAYGTTGTLTGASSLTAAATVTGQGQVRGSVVALSGLTGTMQASYNLAGICEGVAAFAGSGTLAGQNHLPQPGGPQRLVLDRRVAISISQQKR